MQDLSFSFGSFSSTTAQVAATSEAGKSFLASLFGAGAVSVELPKSRADDFARFAEQKGLAVR